MPVEFPKPIKTVWNFFVRVITGIVLFIGIGFGAFLLSSVTTYATLHQLLPGLMLRAMEGLAYFIFFLDLVVFVVFL